MGGVVYWILDITGYFSKVTLMGISFLSLSSASDEDKILREGKSNMQ